MLHFLLQINNAGIMVDEYQTSKQGHEIHFATNHLGHFLLTQLLLPNLASPGDAAMLCLPFATDDSNAVSHLP